MMEASVLLPALFISQGKFFELPMIQKALCTKDAHLADWEITLRIPSGSGDCTKYNLSYKNLSLNIKVNGWIYCMHSGRMKHVNRRILL